MRYRRQEPELMDDPSLARRDHVRALAGLARLNALSQSHMPLWDLIAQAARRANAEHRTLQVLDVAAGSADGPLRLAKRARRHDLRTHWTLCDRSPRALSMARLRARRDGVALRTEVCDVWNAPLPGEADLVTCSLFIHHCDRHQAVDLMRKMANAARVAVGITDLDRTRSGLALAWLASRITCRSRVVHLDALASVRAAYSVSEARELARQAGLVNCTIERVWPERWRLWWRRCDDAA